MFDVVRRMGKESSRPRWFLDGFFPILLGGGKSGHYEGVSGNILGWKA